jgi:hypothetical protein
MLPELVAVAMVHDQVEDVSRVSVGDHVAVAADGDDGDDDSRAAECAIRGAAAKPRYFHLYSISHQAFALLAENEANLHLFQYHCSQSQQHHEEGIGERSVAS